MYLKIAHGLYGRRCQMKMIDNDSYILNTGKKIYANKGLISIDNEGNIYEGYDGELDIKEYNLFTKQERREIAKFMINKWKRYKFGYL